MSLLIKTTGFEEYLDPSGGAWVKCLILGEHGVGKTPSAASWPNPIFADCERGMMSVASKRVPYASIKSTADFEALLRHAKIDSQKPTEKRQYGTFVVDTINSLQRLMINQRLRMERKERMAGEDWGWLGTKLNGYIDDLLNLNMNVLVHMHVKDEKESDGENITLVKKNALKGDLSASIYRDFDLIGLMETNYVAQGGERVRKHYIRWHNEPKYPMLRDRSHKLPARTDVDFTEGDYQRIFDAVFGDVESLPETAEVESLETEAEGEVASANQKGGPVENASTPKAPAKKAAAKKAPAKKAAAKKAAAEEPKKEDTQADKGADTPEVKETPEKDEPAGQDTPSEDPKKDTKEDTATDVPEESESAEDTDPMSVDDDDQADEAAAELVKEELGATEINDDGGDRSEPEDDGVHRCGDAKPGLQAKVTGCRTPLDESNSAKLQIARLKYHTDLCNTCFEKNKKAA